jgi:hypothetical protein
LWLSSGYRRRRSLGYRQALDRDRRTPVIARFGGVHKIFGVDVTPATSGSS